MKKILCILMLVALNVAYAQERPSYFIKDSLCNNFTMDTQGNLYLWHGSTLDKYDATGRILFHYNNPTLGSITSTDATNPMKTMLFFQESGVILFLDNKLAPIGNPLDLFASNFNTITLAAFATTNRLVLFDQSNQDLYITDLNLKVISKTHCTFDQFNPTQLQVFHEQNIIFNNPVDGVYFFDKFGTYEKKISIPNINYFHFIKNSELYYLSNDGLFLYSMKEMQQYLMMFTEHMTKSVYIYSEYAYFLDNNGIMKVEYLRQN